MASVQCALGCGLPVNPHDQQTWKQVTGWVGGPKKNSMKASSDTGEYAHHHCVEMLSQGQNPAEQPSLFDKRQPSVKTKNRIISPDEPSPEEFFGDS